MRRTAGAASYRASGVRASRCGMESALHARDDETISEDAFLGGKMRLRQPRRGYRAGLDALVLAAGVPEGARLMEAGCGVGAALLAVALRFPGASLVGVERHAPHAQLARDNVRLNGLERRVEILEADAVRAPAGTFDGVFFNPPYYDERAGHAPDPTKAHAHLATMSIDRWIAMLSNRLRGGGALTVIHRADHLDQILSGLHGRLGGAAVFPLRPRPGAPASRVVVCARKGSRAPMSLLEGLTVHGVDGAFTPEAQAVLSGEAALRWT